MRAGRVLSWASVLAVIAFVLTTAPGWIAVLQDCDLTWPRLGCTSRDPDPVPDKGAADPGRPVPVQPQDAAPGPPPSPANSPRIAARPARHVTLGPADRVEICDSRYTLTFGYRGTTPADFVFLRGPGDAVTLRLDDPVRISDRCRVTLTAVTRTSSLSADLTIEEE